MNPRDWLAFVAIASLASALAPVLFSTASFWTKHSAGSGRARRFGDSLVLSSPLVFLLVVPAGLAFSLSATGTLNLMMVAPIGALGALTLTSTGYRHALSHVRIAVRKRG